MNFSATQTNFSSGLTKTTTERWQTTPRKSLKTSQRESDICLHRKFPILHNYKLTPPDLLARYPTIGFFQRVSFGPATGNSQS